MLKYLSQIIAYLSIEDRIYLLSQTVQIENNDLSYLDYKFVKKRRKCLTKNKNF